MSNTPQLTKKQIEEIKVAKDEPLRNGKNCPFFSTTEECPVCPLHVDNATCNEKLFWEAKLGLLDKPTTAKVVDQPKFKQISKREYFDLQVEMAKELCHDPTCSSKGVADSARIVVARLLEINEIKIEGE